MTIDANKKYRLTGAEIQDLAVRLSATGEEVASKAEKAQTGSTAPTTSTPGEIGQLYIQSDGTVYILKSIVEESGQPDEYTWEEVGAGGASYTAGDGIDITNNVISATNTGKAKVLTADDYNYPVNNPDGVAMWKVPSGVYTNTNGTKVYLTTGSMSSSPVSMVVAHQDSGNTSIMYSETRGLSNDYPLAGKIVNSSGGEVQAVRPIDTGKITNNLTTTSSGYVLDARQGKTLNDRIGDLSTLTTTDKTSAVAAINELVESGASVSYYSNSELESLWEGEA